MSRQGSPFVVGVRFGLKKDGFAWECLQKVKKTSSDMLGFENVLWKRLYIGHGVYNGEFYDFTLLLYSQHGLFECQHGLS